MGSGLKQVSQERVGDETIRNLTILLSCFLRLFAFREKEVLELAECSLENHRETS